MDKEQLNEHLWQAINEADVITIEKLLATGADPNYHLREDEFIGLAPYEQQPYSPLRLVVFRISDEMIGEIELEQYVQITKLLLQHGADRHSALEYYVGRYGQPDLANEAPFTKVWKLLTHA